MSARSLLIELNNLNSKLWKAGFILDSNDAVQRNTMSGTEVSWAATGPIDYSFDSLAKVDEYIAFIKSRNYSVLIFDGSLLQISYVLRKNEIIKHRLAYYPCPIDLRKSLDYSDSEKE